MLEIAPKQMRDVESAAARQKMETNVGFSGLQKLFSYSKIQNP